MTSVRLDASHTIPTGSRLSTDRAALCSDVTKLYG
jgi:hypothetical protein